MMVHRQLGATGLGAAMRHPSVKFDKAKKRLSAGQKFAIGYVAVLMLTSLVSQEWGATLAFMSGCGLIAWKYTKMKHA